VAVIETQQQDESLKTKEVALGAFLVCRVCLLLGALIQTNLGRADVDRNCG
jgi:hypothetical protein